MTATKRPARPKSTKRGEPDDGKASRSAGATGARSKARGARLAEPADPVTLGTDPTKAPRDDLVDLLARRLAVAVVLSPPRAPADAAQGSALATPEVVFASDDRVGWEPAARSALSRVEGRAPDLVRSESYWLHELIRSGLHAPLGVAADAVQTRALYDELRDGTNVLSAIGGAISKAVRREILLNSLRAVGWNLSHCAERLGLGNASHTLRAIRELDLTSDYEAAKKAGLIPRGGRRTRVDPQPKPRGGEP